MMFLFIERKYDDEVILVGNFRSSNSRRVDDFSLHRLKSSTDFTRRPFTINSSTNRMFTQIQFEEPFLYSTDTWVDDRCDKNLSQILPSQKIYHESGETIQEPQKRSETYGFVYELLSKETPRILFSLQGVVFYYKFCICVMYTCIGQK